MNWVIDLTYARGTISTAASGVGNFRKTSLARGGSIAQRRAIDLKCFKQV